MPFAPTVVALVLVSLALAGSAYFVLCIVAAGRFLRERSRRPKSSFAPPVSILRSLKGLDPQMHSAIRSHCVLDYPEYEVLYGVSDPNDPAAQLVEQLRQEFPAQQMRIVQCPRVLGLNGKVSNLAQMLPQARYEHIVINDSDILVPPDYLRQVFAPFEKPEVGMVTTLYRGLAGKTLGSRLEALGLSTDFTAGVLVARVMEGGIHFALGATIATSKTVLHAIGGLEALADYLGDDYELGARAAAAGYEVELASTVVETALPDYSFHGFCKHQLRWARNIKDRRGAQYFGLVVTFGLAWAVLAVLVAPQHWWTWTTLAVTLLLRVASAMLAAKFVLNDPQVLRDLWLLPLRDLVALGIWIASYAGDEIEWRGQRFRLRRGKLKPA